MSRNVCSTSQGVRTYNVASLEFYTYLPALEPPPKLKSSVGKCNIEVN